MLDSTWQKRVRTYRICSDSMFCDVNKIKMTSSFSSTQQPAEYSTEQNSGADDWWRGAVIYQVYPRSLKDTNGDGVGDLPGVLEKLDYIASLGVDAIWISPFFKSPMKDFGYDVSDYRQVDPLFGTMEDFDRLLAKAHALGLKVIIDQILSHTSDQHRWFTESKTNRTNEKADWYVWANPKDDGSPPNNWLSIFGGCAWQWSTQRQQYYLHNFLVSQPDLNFHNKAVRTHILEEVEFWLKKGVDGIRLDAINFCFHDRLLRDNPNKPPEKRVGRGFSTDNPYAWQYHYFNNTQPENLEFIEELRALLNKYPGTASLGEISSEDSLQTMAEYTEGDKRLHMAYSFELLVDNFSTAHVRTVVEKSQASLESGRACWAIGNHDVARVASRWGGTEKEKQEQFAKLVLAFLVSLPGTICIYQGEELGLTEAALQRDDVQDPYGLAFWPDFKGRDGCRTPMPWIEAEKNAGFSVNNPWLPLPDEHFSQAVDRQLQASDSTLNICKALMTWRRDTPLLTQGNIEFVDSPEGTLVFWRHHNEEHAVFAFNFLDRPVRVLIDNDVKTIEVAGFSTPIIENKNLSLAPLTAFFGKA